MSINKPSSIIRFKLAMPADKYMAYYQGKARHIMVRSLDNRTIKFPADSIRRFLTHEGIFGLFEIQFDENNKLIEIKQINID